MHLKLHAGTKLDICLLSNFWLFHVIIYYFDRVTMFKALDQIKPVDSQFLNLILQMTIHGDFFRTVFESYNR